MWSMFIDAMISLWVYSPVLGDRLFQSCVDWLNFPCVQYGVQIEVHHILLEQTRHRSRFFTTLLILCPTVGARLCQSACILIAQIWKYPWPVDCLQPPFSYPTCLSLSYRAQRVGLGMCPCSSHLHCYICWNLVELWLIKYEDMLVVDLCLHTNLKPLFFVA